MMKYYDTVELERGVIGAICQRDALISHLVSIVTPEDFTSVSCGDVFRFAVSQNAAGKPFDAIIAADFLAGKESNARQYIADCIAYCPSVTQAECYAQNIRAASEERTLRQQVQDVLDSPSEDLAAEIAAICSHTIETRPAGHGRTLAEIAHATYKTLFSKDAARIDTGFGGIDHVLKGLHGGELCIIGARPGGGKSAFGLELAEHAARMGKTVAIYSMEMRSEELFERLIVRNTPSVALDDLIDRQLTEHQAEDIAKATAELSSLPLCIRDSPSTSARKIRADTLATPDVALIIVDYIGLVTPEKGLQNRNLELAQISRDLKKLAMERNIPVVALSQLNREKENNERPTLRDLRDSGALEQDADSVLFLWKYDADKRLVAVSVEKNRRGRTGVSLLQFDGAHMRFAATTERYSPPVASRRGGFLHD